MTGGIWKWTCVFPLRRWPNRYCSVNPWIKSSHTHSYTTLLFFSSNCIDVFFLFSKFIFDEFVDGLRLVNGAVPCHLSVKLGVIVMEMPRLMRSSAIHQFIFAFQSWTWLPHGTPRHLCVCVWVLEKLKYKKACDGCSKPYPYTNPTEFTVCWHNKHK